MKHRVVITGLGVLAPNGVGVDEFAEAIKQGSSGIKTLPELNELGMTCQIGGVPTITEPYIRKHIPEYIINRIDSSTLLFGILAGVEACMDAGIQVSSDVDWSTGVIMGAQSSDGGLASSIVDNLFHRKDIRRIGGRTAEQIITSSVSAYLSGLYGFGNCCRTNSAACATGTEALFLAYQQVKQGYARKMLAGSSEGNSPFTWSVLDRIRALNGGSNHEPERGSRPMSIDASGLVPGCGAGAMVLENMEDALKRGGKIYAEIIGGSNNCGAQRNGGTMTKPNIQGIKKCIQDAVVDASIDVEEVTLISGHLTATYADVLEVQAWSEALGLSNAAFPYINSLKSMTGHCLAAAGSIESVASVIQIREGFIHPSINCENVHNDILKFIDKNRIPQRAIKKEVSCVMKANFGFGDLNTCLIFRKFI